MQTGREQALHATNAYLSVEINAGMSETRNASLNLN
jgi:hypothetical protein